MRTPLTRFQLMVLLIFGAALLAACGSILPQGGEIELATGLDSPEAAAAELPVLQDLESITAFQELFQEDEGRPRLVLLLSPT